MNYKTFVSLRSGNGTPRYIYNKIYLRAIKIIFTRLGLLSGYRVYNVRLGISRDRCVLYTARRVLLVCGQTVN